MKRLALFDFDGTLTRRDTLIEFLRFYHGPGNFYKGMLRLSPILIAYKSRLIKNWAAKERVLTYFLGGEKVSAVEDKGRQFALEKVPHLIRKEALERMHWHLKRQDRVIVVSASASYWIKPWTDQEGVELIATSLEVTNGHLSGRISGRNCYGPEKERRIREELDPDNYIEICAYGDTRGDREMLALASHPYYRSFS